MRIRSWVRLLSAKWQKRVVHLKDRVKNNEIRKATLQSVPFWIASLVAGLLAVLYSEIFRIAESFLYRSDLGQNPWLFVLTPLCFLCAWFLVYRFSQEASGSGIPQLMVGIRYAGQKNKRKIINKLLSARVIIVKIASSTLLLLGGGAIGREGPTIQVAGSVFNAINNRIPRYWPKISHKLMLISGGAAGLAAAFNTPLGGIVFAIEELGKTHLNSIRNRLFVAIIVAGITSKVILGSYLYLGSPAIPEMGGIGFLYVLLAASVAGFCGYLFTRIIIRIVRFKKVLRSVPKKIVWVLVMGFLFAGIVYTTGNHSIGSGRHLMSDLLFKDGFVMDWFAFPSRFLGTIITYLSGGAGGIFAPSLAIGATLGESVVMLLDIPELKNLIIIVGMIGFMAGVTHSPFTSFILVLEMTSAQNSIFPMMLAALIGFGISRGLQRKSLYDCLTEGYMLPEQKPKTRIETNSSANDSQATQ